MLQPTFGYNNSLTQGRQMKAVGCANLYFAFYILLTVHLRTILANNQLDALPFMYLFSSPLYMFRTAQRSSSGGRIVLIHHLVLLVCVSDCLVCLSEGHTKQSHT